MLEMVQEASTLRQIQMEHGVTGSFKDKPLTSGCRDTTRQNLPTDK